MVQRGCDNQVKVLCSWVVPIHRAGQVRISRLRGETIACTLKRREQEAGVEAFTSHDMRRTFISQLLEAGADVFTAQKLAGHADPMTTARYDRRGEERQARATGLLALPGREGGSGWVGRGD